MGRGGYADARLGISPGMAVVFASCFGLGEDVHSSTDAFGMHGCSMIELVVVVGCQGIRGSIRQVHDFLEVVWY